LGAGVRGDLAGGLLERAHQDRRAGALVALEAVGDLLDRVDRVDQRDATAGDDAFLDGRAGGREGVLEAVLLLLELRLGGRADADHGDAAGELGQALLELLARVVGVGGLELGLDGLDALVDDLAVALALDDGRLVLARADALGAAELGEADVLELVAELLADDLTAGDGSDVAEHLLAAVAEAGGLDGEHVERATQLVEHQRGERLALDVLGDDQERLAGLDDLLEYGQEVLQRADLLLVDEDVGVLEHRLHRVGVGDEVGADVALVELHALDDVELGVEGLRLLDGDDAVAADLVHSLGDELADGGLVRGDRGDLGDGLAVLDAAGHALDALDCGLDGLLDTALEGERAGAGGDVPQALADDRLAEHGGGGGAVTGDLVRLAGDLDEELGADVLDRVLELDVLGDGHAVLGDRRAAELLLQDDVAPLRPERDLDGVRDGVDAAFESAARVFLVDQVLGHVPSASLATGDRLTQPRTAWMSRWLRIMSSRPSSSISVPPYLANTTVSPTFTSMGSREPLS